MSSTINSENQVQPQHLVMRVRATQAGYVLRLANMTITPAQDGSVGMISWPAQEGSGMAPSGRVHMVSVLNQAAAFHRQNTRRNEFGRALSPERVKLLNYLAQYYNARMALLTLAGA